MTDGDSEATQRTLTLTTGGITLLSVLLGIGVTVGLGVEAPWLVQVAAGAATTILLITAVKLGTSAGRGPLARLAAWVIGRPASGGKCSQASGTFDVDD